MAVQLIDHVKKETVHLRSAQFKSGRFLQVTDDLKLRAGGQVIDSSNVSTFMEISAISEDCTDSPSGDCLVSIQFDHRGANYVVCPRRTSVTTETTLQLRAKKVELEDVLDRKAERVGKKCQIYWFKLQSSQSGTCVYESLAYKDFYISIEGQNVLLRKYTLGIPQEENFQIDIFPIHMFAEKYHRVTTEERREMVNGETRRIAVTREGDHILTSGAYIIGERGDVQFTDLHVTEIQDTEEYEGKYVRMKSKPSDNFDIAQNVPADKSSDTMSSDSSEMSSAPTDVSSSEESLGVGTRPSTVSDMSAVSHGKSISSEETSSSTKPINTRRSPSSFTGDHSSDGGKLSASGCGLSASPSSTPEEVITERITSSVTEVYIKVDDQHLVQSKPSSFTGDHTSDGGKLSASGCDLSASPPSTEVIIERITSSVTELDIKVDDQDLDHITLSQKQTPPAHDITEEVRTDGDNSREQVKDCRKRPSKQEKKRKRRFALSRIFSCVSSRSGD